MTFKPRILVVDDDEPILVLMKNILREFQFEPAVASSGSAALREAQQHAPDLVLLDMNMPEMSGEQFVAALRSENALSHVPVLILSGDPVSDEDLNRVGAQGAIQKPFDLMRLIQQIREQLAPAATLRQG